jgi:putative flippase GtrA
MKIYKQAALYYFISASAFIINLLIYGFLIYFGHVYYLYAATIGFAIQNILEYISWRIWVFNKTHIHPIEGYLRSFGIAVIILAIILLLTYMGVHVFLLNYMWARIFAGVIGGIASFILDKKITFAL